MKEIVYESCNCLHTPYIARKDPYSTYPGAMEKEINENFHSQIYKFKINLNLENHKDDILTLNDSNKDFLKDGFEEMFMKLKSSYKKRDFYFKGEL